MNTFLREALAIVKAQARTRSMTEDELASMIRSLAAEFRGTPHKRACTRHSPMTEAQRNPSASITENSVICLECGDTFKMLTRRHLEKHGIDVDEYLEKWGLRKGTPLVCEPTRRQRRKKINSLRIWEKRHKKS